MNSTPQLIAQFGIAHCWLSTNVPDFEDLHEGTDEECLEVAQLIRLILADLAERISETLKKTEVLDIAVSKLKRRKQEMLEAQVRSKKGTETNKVQSKS